MRIHRLALRGAIFGTFLALASCQRQIGLRAQLLREYAATPRRPIASRLVGFPFAPDMRPRGNQDRVAEFTTLSTVAHRILGVPLREGDAVETRRLHAEAELVIGNAAAATGILESALRKERDDASLWIDYTAALCERARIESDVRTLAAALGAADHALFLAPHSREARFNRALVLQRLALDAAAEQAWKHYLEIERERSWIAEAQQNLQHASAVTVQEEWKRQRNGLEELAASGRINEVDRFIAAFPQQVRRWAETECLMRWAQHWTKGERTDANRVLVTAGTIGDRLFAFRGEGLLRRAVAVTKRAIITDEASATELAQAHLRYDAARRLIAARRPTEAVASLRDAERRFSQLGSPMALVARTYRAGVVFDGRDADAARALLDSVEAEARPEFKALRGEVKWERARIAGRLGETWQALGCATEAVQIFDSLGERDNAARNRSEMASLLAVLGRPIDSWQIRQQVFADASKSGAPSVLATALYAAANDETAEGRLEVSRSLFDVLLQGTIPSSLMEFHSKLWRVFLAIRLGEALDRQKTLDDLASAAATIEDPALREDAFDQLRFVDAITSTDRQHALRLLSDCITFREKAGRLSRAADAYSESGRLHEESGDSQRATQDFTHVLETLERQRDSVQDIDLRDSFFGAAEQACDHLIGLCASSNNRDGAFQIAERCRGRRILESLSAATPPHPMPLREVQRRLPDGVALIHYSALFDRLVTIVITASATNMRVTPVGRSRVESATAAFHDALYANDSGLHRHARDLYSILIAPIDSMLVNARLVIVGDPTIMSVPFSALEDGTNTPLVMHHEIAFAPSATAFVHSEWRRRAAIDNALLIGDPAFKRGLGGGLERLPSAAAEVQAISAGYARATVLTGDAATTEALTENANRSDLIHIAAHAVVNERNAAQNALLLAPSSSHDDGVLQLRDIARLPLKQYPLVILAGCRTGAFGGGKGSVRSLAFAFLAAGSRGVVASLWDVEDDMARAFSEGLHRRIRSGIPAATALRATQIELMTSRDERARRPSVWSAFQLYTVE